MVFSGFKWFVKGFFSCSKWFSMVFSGFKWFVKVFLVVPSGLQWCLVVLSGL